MKRLILKLILVVLIVIIVCSACNIAFMLINYNEADSLYSEMNEQFVNVAPPETTEVIFTDIVVTQESVNTLEVPAVTEVPKQPAEPLPINVDFESLSEKNKDIIGWIYSEGTPISYPVVQASNNDKYLRRDINGKYLISGTLFVDYRNDKIGSDLNYIIYGHNMNNSSMFGSLLDYQSQQYYEKHPYVYYLTPDGDYKIELFAGVFVSTDKEDIYKTEPNSSAFSTYINKLIGKSTFISNVEYNEGDRIVTLSTCSDYVKNVRYVVLGKLIEI